MAGCDWCHKGEYRKGRFGIERYEPLHAELMWICPSCRQNRAAVTQVVERRSAVLLIPVVAQLCLLAVIITLLALFA